MTNSSRRPMTVAQLREQLRVALGHTEQIQLELQSLAKFAQYAPEHHILPNVIEQPEVTLTDLGAAVEEGGTTGFEIAILRVFAAIRDADEAMAAIYEHTDDITAIDPFNRARFVPGEDPAKKLERIAKVGDPKHEAQR